MIEGRNNSFYAGYNPLLAEEDVRLSNTNDDFANDLSIDFKFKSENANKILSILFRVFVLFLICTFTTVEILINFI